MASGFVSRSDPKCIKMLTLSVYSKTVVHSFPIRHAFTKKDQNKRRWQVDAKKRNGAKNMRDIWSILRWVKRFGQLMGHTLVLPHPT